MIAMLGGFIVFLPELARTPAVAMLIAAWGMARPYERRSHPARPAENELPADILHIIDQMRVVHKEAITELLTRQRPSVELVLFQDEAERLRQDR